ncbi:MAG: hypothetical protein Kow00107_02330 [Planctomycetota bacterium]
MNVLIRAAAVVFAVLLAAFAIYVFWGTDPSGEPIAKPSVLPNQFQAQFSFKSHEECRECHPAYYEEWERSWHKMAWTDKWVQASFGCYRDQDCKACHLPYPIMADGRQPRLIPREDDPESGINCLTCHMSPMGVLGPEGREVQMTKHCSPVKHEQIATDAQCWECHPNQYDDWMTSSFKNKKGCKDCHMDEVERPLVPNGPVRKTRVHFWKGSHTYTFLKTAYEYKVEPTAQGLSVTVANTQAGHYLPAERHNRALWVEVTFFDLDGKQVGEMEKWVIREGSNQPRNLKTLEIKPDRAVTKMFAYPIASGTAKAVLKYDFFYANEDEHTRVLEDPPPIRFGQ